MSWPSTNFAIEMNLLYTFAKRFDIDTFTKNFSKLQQILQIQSTDYILILIIKHYINVFVVLSHFNDGFNVVTEDHLNRAR
jgi:hypothetical protein